MRASRYANPLRSAHPMAGMRVAKASSCLPPAARPIAADVQVARYAYGNEPIGHLDEAAGITGLIKTVLTLQHAAIPPSLHFEHPNPKIDFDQSPFYVPTRLSRWDGNGVPRRGGSAPASAGRMPMMASRKLRLSNRALGPDLRRAGR